MEIVKIIHKPTGLFFNGYNEYYKDTIGKNTLSLTNFKSYVRSNRTDEEVLEKAFEGYHKVDDDGKKYMKNNIVYSGSEIHEVLSKFYDDYEYLPYSDFIIEIK